MLAMPQTAGRSSPSMPAIVEDQTFPTLQDFKNALREWAIERNFTPHILDSDSHRVRAGCRSSPNCPFRIRANYNEKRGNAKVTTCDDVHNCVSNSHIAAHQNIKRAETGRLKFLVEAVPKLITVGVATTTAEIIEAVERKYGQKIPVRQAQKVKRALAGRIHGPCRYCHLDGHSKRNCPTRKRDQATGIMNRPEDVHAEMFDFGQDGIASDSDRDHEPPSDRRCTLCFQPGHNRGNCPCRQDPPNSTTPSQSHQPNAITRPSQPQVSSATPNHSDSFLDPILVSSSSSPMHGLPTLPSQPRSTTPNINVSPLPPTQAQRALQTPSDARKEAARLMSQAAMLMNEAAKLNAEAARITSALANS
ncbi:MAG: hypothetical protein LQ351_007813 [Letrouitia transgressa]|nr:MAG: hypothetical protein LQ351_007813 [Letrouitia transgressa]